MTGDEKRAGTQGKRARVGGLNMYYEETGAGEPLLLLHGSMGTGRVWSPYVPILGQRFHLIVPDARGHGRTSLPDDSLDVETMAGDCAAFVRALELDSVFLCGWSMGADVALAVAMHDPDLVRGLIIGGLTYRASETYLVTLQAMGLEGPGKVDFGRAQTAIPELIATWRREHTLGPTHWKDLLTRLSFEMVSPSLPSSEAIRAVSAPTLIVWGDRDQFLAVEQAVELHRLFPDSELAVIPNADHFVTRTHVEQFASLMAGFIKRTVSRPDLPATGPR